MKRTTFAIYYHFQEYLLALHPKRANRDKKAQVRLATASVPQKLKQHNFFDGVFMSPSFHDFRREHHKDRQEASS